MPKISALPAGSTPAGADVYAAVQGSDTNKLTHSQLYEATKAALGDDDPLLTPDSDDLFPTKSAVKAYVDAAVGGSVAGLAYTASATTTDADPGAALMRWNNATQASATFLYVDEVDADGTALDALFSNLASGSVITIADAADPDIWQRWRMTGAAVDGTGYWKLPVALEAQEGGNIAGADDVTIDVDKSAGGGGTPGGADTQVQYNNAGAFGAEAAFTYDQATNTLSVETIAMTGAINQFKGADIARAGTTDIAGATGDFVDLTGTAAITAFGTAQAGTERTVRFTGVGPLTHNATSLILQTAADITTAAGDTAIFRSLGSGNWRCIVYVRASGAALIGGATTNWTESVDSAAPNATIPAVRWLATDAAANVDAVISAKGTGATLAQTPDNTTAGGNKRGPRATDWQKGTRASSTMVASGSDSVIAGGSNNTAAGAGAVVGGGSDNAATAGTIAGGTNNITGHAGATVGGGNANTAGGTGNANSTVSGGNVNNASGTQSAIAGGNNNTASGTNSFSWGRENIADAQYSSATGHRATTRGIFGYQAFSSRSLSGQGDSQRGEFTAPLTTSDATATPLLTDASGTPTANNQLALEVGSSSCFTGKVTARRASNGDFKTWLIQGAANNIAGTMGNGTTAPTATVVSATAGASGWDVTFALDTTNDAQQIIATGEAAATISWTLHVQECYTRT